MLFQNLASKILNVYATTSLCKVWIMSNGNYHIYTLHKLPSKYMKNLQGKHGRIDNGPQCATIDLEAPMAHGLPNPWLSDNLLFVIIV
jgi:hypothetical protein